MSRVDVVAAIHVLAVDGQAKSGKQLQHPLSDDQGRDLGRVKLRGTLVVWIGNRHHGDEHGDGAVVVVQAHQKEDSAEDDESESQIDMT